MWATAQVHSVPAGHAQQPGLLTHPTQVCAFHTWFKSNLLNPTPSLTIPHSPARRFHPLFAALASHIQSGFPHLLARLVAIALAPQNSLSQTFHHWRNQWADTTFNNLYRWNAFDAALLIPYFAVMILLAIYGLHRYTLVYLYFKYRKNYNPNPPQHFAELPRVTIQLLHVQRAVRHRPPHRIRLRHRIPARPP